MPTPYIEFCDAVKNLTPEEEAWWKQQLDKMDAPWDEEKIARHNRMLDKLHRGRRLRLGRGRGSIRLRV